MKVHYGVENIEIKCPIVTIGSFDGVHLGHACVIQHLKEKAASIDGESVIISFEPHPREVLYPREQKNRDPNDAGREDCHLGKIWR